LSIAKKYLQGKQLAKKIKLMDLQGIEPQGGSQHWNYYTVEQEYLTGPLVFKLAFAPKNEDQ
jgi:hypothetical protein